MSFMLSRACQWGKLLTSLEYPNLPSGKGLENMGWLYGHEEAGQSSTKRDLLLGMSKKRLILWVLGLEI